MNIPIPEGEIGRKDLATNFHKHYQTELQSFGETNQLSLAETLNLHSPPDEDGAGRSDALLDTIAQLGLRTDVAGNMPASSLGDFFGRGEAEHLLGREYLEEVFHLNIGRGLVDYEYNHDSNLVELASPSARGSVTEPFDQPTYGIEVRRDVRVRLMLMHVIGKRIPITGSTYKPGVVETPEDTKLRPVAEGTDLPEYLLKTGSQTVTTQKIGYGLRITDELIGNASMTMELVTETQRQKAAQVENALVNATVQLVGDGATAHALTAMPTDLEWGDLHLLPDDSYAISIMVGTRGYVSRFKTTDFYYNSFNMKPTTPMRRQYIDEYAELETVAKKTPAQVATLTETGPKDVGIAWDRMCGVNYVVERRAMISESDRNTANQTTLITNSHRYQLYKPADADQCRYRVVLG